ncbi:MAG: hypothetical protein AAB439_03395 [Patescibacteria group bacterium]
MIPHPERILTPEVIFETGVREARRPGVDLEYGARTSNMVFRETGGTDSPLMQFLTEGEFGAVYWKSFEERAELIQEFFSVLFF